MVTISHNNKWIRFHNSIFFVCSFQATHLSYLEQFLPCQFMNTDVVAALLYCITWNHFKKQSCVLFSTAFWVGARWFRGTLPFLRSFFWCCQAVHASVIVKANYQHRIVAAGCGDFVECDRPTCTPFKRARLNNSISRLQENQTISAYVLLSSWWIARWSRCLLIVYSLF